MTWLTKKLGEIFSCIVKWLTTNQGLANWIIAIATIAAVIGAIVIGVQQNKINQNIFELNLVPSIALNYENGKFIFYNYGKSSFYIDLLRMPNYKFFIPIQKTVFPNTQQDITFAINSYLQQIPDGQLNTILEFLTSIKSPSGDKNYLALVGIFADINNHKISLLNISGNVSFYPLNMNFYEYVQKVTNQKNKFMKNKNNSKKLKINFKFNNDISQEESDRNLFHFFDFLLDEDNKNKHKSRSQKIQNK